MALEHPMDDLLARLKDSVNHMHEEKVSIRFLADAHGESAHGALLIFLSVLTILPVPLSGFVFSFGIFAVAWMMWKRDNAHGLPEFVCKVEIAAPTAKKMVEMLTKIYSTAGKLSKPRLEHLTTAANRIWLVPFIVTMGIIIFLPIPFGNGTPAVALILIGLGLLGKDGLAMVLGMIAGVAAVGMLVFLVWTAKLAILWAVPG